MFNNKSIWRSMVKTVAILITVTSMMFSGCKDDDPSSEVSISIKNQKDLTQTAYADNTNTGQGFTFTAKENWTASVKSGSSLRASDVAWIKLYWNGVETYSGDAGTFTIAISIEVNTTGQNRSATIDIASGSDRISISVTQDGKTEDGQVPTTKSSAKQITAFNFTSPAATGVINEAAKTIAIEAPSGTNVTSLTPTISVSSKASVSPASGVAQNFTNPLRYTVTAEDGSTVQYTATVTVKAATETELTSAMINQTNASLAMGVYIVKSNLTLNGGNNLTIAPGVVIRFDENRSLTAQSNAKIIAKGTSSQKITFTSNLQTPSPGDWGSIAIYGTNNEFDHCIFEYGGRSSAPNYGMISLDNATVSFTNCTFRNSRYSGIWVYGSNSRFLKFENNTMSACGENEASGYPINVSGASANLSCLGDMGNNTITTAKGIRVVQGTVSRDITIKAFVPYVITGNQTFNNSAVITIEPGAKLKIDEALSIVTNGGAKIIANGTSSQNITFTSSKTNPQSGDWNSITIYSNGSEFKHCVFEYGARSSAPNYGMLSIDNAKVSITNCVLRNSRYSGIWLYGTNSGFTAFDNNNIINCGENEASAYPIITSGASANVMNLAGMGENNSISSTKGIAIAGTVNGNLTLKKYLYTVFNNITITQTAAGGATLTITPGSKLMFAQNTYLSVGAGGKLIADGTSSNKIIFTGSTLNRGWWDGIMFITNGVLSGSLLNHCEISYGGRGVSSNSNGNINCWTNSSTGYLTVRNCTITHSRAWGIFVSGNSTSVAPTVENNNTYSNNGPSNNSNYGSTVIGVY